MIDLNPLNNNHLRFNCDSIVIQQLNSRYQNAADLLCEISNSSDGFMPPTEDLHLLAKHPLAQGLLAYQRGYITPERAQKFLSELSQLDQYSLDALAVEKQLVLQLQCLLPEVDTRGESIQVIDNNKCNQIRLDESLKKLIDCCGDDYRRFLEIVKTVSIVRVSRLGELPYFSGANTDTWGAIHTTEPTDDFVLAETLTHEAAHHWLFVLEEIAPMAKDPWNGDSWISPWRSDPRPIGGVIHGVYVFSCAALVLNSLYACKNFEIEELSKIRIAKRICRLCAQVEAGLDEMHRCPDITPAGISLSASAFKRIKSVADMLDGEMLSKAREQCEKEQHLKREKHL